jgi:hypothetical protein
MLNSIVPRALRKVGSGQRTVVQKRSASQVAASAAAKDGTTDRPVDLVGTTDPPVKRLWTESHAGEASDLVANVEKTTNDAANSKATAKDSSDPAVELGRKSWWATPR